MEESPSRRSRAWQSSTKELEQQAAEPRAIGWDGASARGMLEESERLFADTGRYYGVEDLGLKESDEGWLGRELPAL